VPCPSSASCSARKVARNHPPARERLNGVEGRSARVDNLLQRQIKGIGAIIGRVCVAGEAPNSWRKRVSRLHLSSRIRSAVRMSSRRIAGIDIDPECAHPLGRIRCPQVWPCLCRRRPPRWTDSGCSSGARHGVADDAAHRIASSMSPYTSDANAISREPAVHHQSAHRPPALGARMRPSAERLCRCWRIAHRAYQMSSPHPGAGEKHHGITRSSCFIFFRASASFLLARNYGLVLDQLQPGLGKRGLCLCNQSIVHKGVPIGSCRPSLCTP